MEGRGNKISSMNEGNDDKTIQIMEVKERQDKVIQSLGERISQLKEQMDKTLEH